MPSFLRSRKRGHKALTLHTESLLLPSCWWIDSPVTAPAVGFWFACRVACRRCVDEISSTVRTPVVANMCCCQAGCGGHWPHGLEHVVGEFHAVHCSERAGKPSSYRRVPGPIRSIAE